MNESIDFYIESYGKPLLRFCTGASGNDQIYGDVPDECAVFKINHPSKVMVVSRYGDTWCCNHGERAVIFELIGRAAKNQGAVAEQRTTGQVSPCEWQCSCGKAVVGDYCKCGAYGAICRHGARWPGRCTTFSRLE